MSGPRDQLNHNIPLDNTIRYSQSALQSFKDCKKHYQLRYLKKLDWPSEQADPQLQNERQMAEGNLFHKLIHQYLLGVPKSRISSLLEAENNPNLNNWWNNFIFSIDSKLLDCSAFTQTYPEFTIAQNVGSAEFIAKVDLVGLSGDEIHIYDWKTTRFKPNRSTYENSIQSILYMALMPGSVFARKFGSGPIFDKIKMTYWFANYPNQSVNISYTSDKHQAGITYLSTLVREVHTEEVFPKTEDIRICSRCIFRSYCDRGVKAGNLSELDNELFEDGPDLFQGVVDHDL